MDGLVEQVTVPDIGDFDTVDVVEVLVTAGDAVAVDDPLITLESDKATMDVPSPKAGKVVEVKVKTGDTIGTGGGILTLAVSETTGADTSTPEPETDGSGTRLAPQEETEAALTEDE